MRPLYQWYESIERVELATFTANPQAYIERAKTIDTPIALTVDGRPVAVAQDAASFDK